VIAAATTLSVAAVSHPYQSLDDVLARAAEVSAAFAGSTLRVICQENDRQTIVVDPIAMAGEPASNPTEWAFRDVVAGWSIAPPSRAGNEGWKELHRAQSIGQFQSFPGKDPVTTRTTALVDAFDVPAPFPRFAGAFVAASNQSRFQFKKGDETEVGGLAVWEVTFRETATPPFWILPLSGSLWIDPSTGQVVRSVAAVKGRDPFADSLTVEYRVDPPSGLNLPHRFTRRTHLSHFKHERLWVDTTGTFTACRVLPASTH